ncbi:N-acetyltransferase [Thalassovita sp.]|uniref:GNAT family N-acetyltransferase n=1 Tax=Thalassovita sp. TaxID=1979401 RepID=UPI0029DE5FB8|nr:N-acetyltransferase [Thalassovita sp.]
MIRVFDPYDSALVAQLTDRAYGRSYEAWLVQALRDAGDLVAEYVWDAGSGILGHVCMARHIHPQDWLVLSTLSVEPAARGQGIGHTLVRTVLDVARAEGAGAVTVLGDARYYQRFGFTRTAAEALETPFSRDNTLMYPIRIENAGLMAELVYPPAYSRL